MKKNIQTKFKYDINEIIYYKGGFYEGYHKELAKVIRRSVSKERPKYKIEFLKDGKVATIEERFLGSEEELKEEKIESNIIKS